MTTILNTLKERKTALTIREVSELLNVSASLLYRLAASGRVPSFRVAGAVRFDPSNIADWYEAKQPINVDGRQRSRLQSSSNKPIGQKR
jgi:excisionase family DNA binding protein